MQMRSMKTSEKSPSELTAPALYWADNLARHSDFYPVSTGLLFAAQCTQPILEVFTQ